MCTAGMPTRPALNWLSLLLVVVLLLLCRRELSEPSDPTDWGASGLVAQCVSRRDTGCWYCLEHLRWLESHSILCRPEHNIPLPVFRYAFRRATLMERPLSGFIRCVDMCVFAQTQTFC